MSVVPYSPSGGSGAGAGGALLSRYDLQEPQYLDILYDAPLSDAARFIGIDPYSYQKEWREALDLKFACAWPPLKFGGEANPKKILSLLCGGPCLRIYMWETHLKERAYVQVHENRIETNYPIVLGPCIVDDAVTIQTFDSVKPKWKRTKRCVEWQGQVATGSSGLCGDKELTGLVDAEAFSTAVMAAKVAFDKKARLRYGAFQTRDKLGEVLPPQQVIMQ